MKPRSGCQVSVSKGVPPSIASRSSVLKGTTKCEAYATRDASRGTSAGRRICSTLSRGTEAMMHKYAMMDESRLITQVPGIPLIQPTQHKSSTEKHHDHLGGHTRLRG